MKKIIVLFVALFALVAFSGCTSLNKSVASYPVNGSAPSAIVPDITVGDKISGTSSIQKILFFESGDNELADGVNYEAGASLAGALGLPASLASKAKAAAAYKAVTDSGADFIVAPRYTVKTLGVPFLYQEVSATVTGYKGTIKGFHQVKDADLFK